MNPWARAIATGSVVMAVSTVLDACGQVAPTHGDATAPDATRPDGQSDAGDAAMDAASDVGDAAVDSLSCGDRPAFGISACCGIDAEMMVCRGFCDPYQGGACSCGIAGGCKGESYCCHGACQSKSECLK